MPVEVVFANQAMALGDLNGVFLNVVRKPSTLEDLAEVRRWLEKHFKKHKQVASIAIIEPHAAQSPPKEFREATTALTREFKSLAAAIVIEGDGFRAAASRTLVATIYLVNRAGYPHKICATPDEAAAWLMATLKPNPFATTAAELSRALEICRSAIQSPPPAQRAP